jgi:hypothetical protein
LQEISIFVANVFAIPGKKKDFRVLLLEARKLIWKSARGLNRRKKSDFVPGCKLTLR